MPSSVPIFCGESSGGIPQGEMLYLPPGKDFLIYAFGTWSYPMRLWNSTPNTTRMCGNCSTLLHSKQCMTISVNWMVTDAETACSYSNHTRRLRNVHCHVQALALSFLYSETTCQRLSIIQRPCDWFADITTTRRLLYVIATIIFHSSFHWQTPSDFREDRRFQMGYVNDARFT
ncbi:hypothetical protein V8E53_014862 [Lactarius tabidus]|jgi:hypothetical protein